MKVIIEDRNTASENLTHSHDLLIKEFVNLCTKNPALSKANLLYSFQIDPKNAKRDCFTRFICTTYSQKTTP